MDFRLLLLLRRRLPGLPRRRRDCQGFIAIQPFASIRVKIGVRAAAAGPPVVLRPRRGRSRPPLPIWKCLHPQLFHIKRGTLRCCEIGPRASLAPLFVPSFKQGLPGDIAACCICSNEVYCPLNESLSAWVCLGLGGKNRLISVIPDLNQGEILV